jgi:hypothetical protein
MQYTLFGNGNVEGGYNRTIDFLKKRDFLKKAGLSIVTSMFWEKSLSMEAAQVTV